ncbi:YcnI family protein [Paenibacillus sp. RRE4]|uniref:YcnI family copper-binding membrane protein n=1 Tax=Paenibacillus sp. RRE4 TaxID=2962587 RepID=UPI002881313F|nr:YcnI family protein [Paenibacillus sp. RRE4]MDT0125057.1 YcnI family protein [Paenibacillus sp. RRE4]
MKKTSWVSKLTSAMATGAAAFLLFSGLASAHVTVNPSVAQTSAWQTYTIKIPSEKELPTTKITLKIPEGVAFKQYQPLAGWKITTEKNDSNEVTSITWEIDGDNQGILAGQFQQFNFVAQNPKTETEVAWDAFQYYSDGSIVEWTGQPGANSPHSITTISEDPAAAGNAATGGDHHSAGGASNGHDSAGTAGTATGDKASDTATDGKKGNDDTTLGDALSDTVTGQPNNTDSDAGTLKLQQATLIVSILALIMSFLGIALATRRKKR